MLTEELKKHITDLIYNLLSEGIEGASEQKLLSKITSGEKVYHRPKDSYGADPLATIKSLFRRGFSREYTGSNGGNMYGTGVYNVYTLRSSNEKASGYGRYILQSYVVDGYRDFLIFNKDIAKKYYGENWWIGKQIQMLMPEPMAKRILYVMQNRLFMNDFNSLDRKTASVAKEIFDLIGERGMKQTRIRGIIYDGGHDGSCAFVRDFSDVCPYAYSRDNGRTWERGINKELMQHVLGNIDTDFELKGRLDANGKKQFDDVSTKSVNGFAMTFKGDKVNYYSVETRSLISDIWFEHGMPFDKNGYADVMYNGINLCIHNDGGGNYSVTDRDGAYICDLSELKELF